MLWNHQCSETEDKQRDQETVFIILNTKCFNSPAKCYQMVYQELGSHLLVSLLKLRDELSDLGRKEHLIMIDHKNV